MAKVEQFEFSRFRDASPRKTEICLDIGSPAVEILQKIDSHLPIRNFFYIEYNSSLRYEDPFKPISKPKILKKEFIRDREKLGLLSKEVLVSSKMVLGIASKVYLRPFGEGHMPMMDLDCPKSEESLNKIQEALKGFSGFILDSGNSYHFWGTQILSIKGWEDFMNYCDKWRYEIYENTYDNIFDSDYINDCKKKGFSVLRVFPTPVNTSEPKVVKILK